MMLGVTWFFAVPDSFAQALYPTDTRKPAQPSRPKGKAQTVSVSPYARSNNTANSSTNNAAKPAQQTISQPVAHPVVTAPKQQPFVAPAAKSPQHVLTLPEKYKQKTEPTESKPIVTAPVLPKATSASVMPATPLATAPVPDSLAKPLTGMSIADVIDSTIKNAPDMPQQVASVTPPPEKITESEPAKPALLSVSEPEDEAPAKAAPHQPSKQDIAGLGEDKPRFYWPLRGRVISTFGAKGSGKQNDGMNITAPKGTAVRSAANGLVVYSGKDLGGLGNLVLIRHSGGYHTAYAHVDNPLVQTGDKVKAGEAIANVGKTGNVTTPQLHFEIRQGKKAVNPSKYLPQA